MPSILITNHKGGVGKTFLTVHIAKCFAESSTGERVLVADCDGQYDAYEFFAEQLPDKNGDYFEVTRRLGVVANQDCVPLSKMNITEENYDFIFLDSDARLADAVKNVVQDQIQLVIVPVNFQSLSISNLEELFDALGKIFKTNKPLGNLSNKAGGADVRTVIRGLVGQRHFRVATLGR